MDRELVNKLLNQPRRRRIQLTVLVGCLCDKTSGVARILCQGAQVSRREKTENNKCMSYHPSSTLRHCIRPVCHSYTIIK